MQEEDWEKISNEEETRRRPAPLFATGMEVLDGSTPWLREDLLPEKPQGFRYGARFKTGGVISDKPCASAEELAILLSNQGAEAVYLPDQERGVPVSVLSWFKAMTRNDFRGYFLSVLKKRGLVALVAIGLAVYLADPRYSQILILAGLLFGVFPVFDAFLQWVAYPKKLTEQQIRGGGLHWENFSKWIGLRNPRWALVLPILIFVLVFLGQNFGAGTYREITMRGAIVPGLIRDGGEWWRLITGPLMHSADMALVLHIGFNSIMFWILGKYLGSLTHPLMVWIVFVLAAPAGAVASVLFLPAQTQGSVGASGGVLGLLGFLFWLIQSRKNAFPFLFRSFVIRVAALVAVLGMLLFFVVDNAGHAGGFLCGLICGATYDLWHRNQWAVKTTPALVTLGGLSLAVMIFGLAAAADLFFFRGELFVSQLPKIAW